MDKITAMKIEKYLLKHLGCTFSVNHTSFRITNLTLKNEWQSGILRTEDGSWFQITQATNVRIRRNMLSYEDNRNNTFLITAN